MACTFNVDTCSHMTYTCNVDAGTHVTSTCTGSHVTSTCTGSHVTCPCNVANAHMYYDHHISNDSCHIESNCSQNTHEVYRLDEQHYKCLYPCRQLVFK